MSILCKEGVPDDLIGKRGSFTNRQSLVKTQNTTPKFKGSYQYVVKSSVIL